MGKGAIPAKARRIAENPPLQAAVDILAGNLAGVRVRTAFRLWGTRSTGQVQGLALGGAPVCWAQFGSGQLRFTSICAAQSPVW